MVQDTDWRSCDELQLGQVPPVKLQYHRPLKRNFQPAKVLAIMIAIYEKAGKAWIAMPKRRIFSCEREGVSSISHLLHRGNTHTDEFAPTSSIIKSTLVLLRQLRT